MLCQSPADDSYNTKPPLLILPSWLVPSMIMAMEHQPPVLALTFLSNVTLSACCDLSLRQQQQQQQDVPQSTSPTAKPWQPLTRKFSPSPSYAHHRYRCIRKRARQEELYHKQQPTQKSINSNDDGWKLLFPVQLIKKVKAKPDQLVYQALFLSWPNTN